MKKEFSITPKRKQRYLLGAFLLIALWEIWLFTSLFVFERSNIDIFFYVVSLSSLLFAIERIIDAYTEKIVLTDKELLYKRLGLSVSISWRDFSHSGSYRTLVHVDDVIFAPKGKTTLKGINSSGIYGKEAWIPLSHFAANWRDSELGQQIKQYAPHLFEKEKSA